MSWINFCEAFTILNLVALAFALFVLIGASISCFVSFVKKIKDYFFEFDILKERFERVGRTMYHDLQDLDTEVKKLKKGSKKNES